MSDEPVASTRPLSVRLALIALVVLAGFAASLALWDPLEMDERGQINRLTRQSLAGIKTDLNSDLRSLLLAHVRLAETWAVEEPGQSLLSTEWTLNCRLFLEHYPGDLALQWFDSNYELSWTLGRDALGGGRAPQITFDRVPASLLQVAVKRGVGQATVLPPFRLSDGRTAMWVVVPVARNAAPYGFLVALLDARATLDTMLDDQLELGYSISVLNGDHEVYRSTAGTQDLENDWSHQADLPILSDRWTIRVWPNRDLMAELRSSLPELAAVLGALLGSALVLTIYFGRAAQSRSRELRRTHDGLEQRVRRRTTELERANDDLKAQILERRRAEESLRHLSGRLLQLQDEERRRIARELHDSTTQALGALAINVDQAQRLAPQVEGTNLRSLLGDSRELVDQVSLEIRTVSYLLHPPMLDELGLEYVLHWFVEGFSRRSGIAVDMDIQPDLGRLPPEVETTLFRIAQEAMTNVHRHSGSITATIELHRDSDTATLVIEDQGRGMPPDVLEPTRHPIATLGIGIAGMRERVRQLGGRLEISGSSRGTVVRVVLPLPSQPPAAD